MRVSQPPPSNIDILRVLRPRPCMKGSIYEERSTADSPDHGRIWKRRLSAGICAKLCWRPANESKCGWRSCQAKFPGPASQQGRIRCCFTAFEFKRSRETNFAHRASDFSHCASDQDGFHLSHSTFDFKVSCGLLCHEGNQSIANAVMHGGKWTARLALAMAPPVARAAEEANTAR